MHRRYTDSPMIRKVLQTLWYQVNNGQEIYVVGVILEDGTVRGGTGWGAEFAKLCNKPLFVFDQDKDGWFEWTGDDWKARHGHARHHPPALHRHGHPRHPRQRQARDRGPLHEVVRIVDDAGPSVGMGLLFVRAAATSAVNPALICLLGFTPASRVPSNPVAFNRVCWLVEEGNDDEKHQGDGDRGGAPDEDEPSLRGVAPDAGQHPHGKADGHEREATRDHQVVSPPGTVRKCSSE